MNDDVKIYLIKRDKDKYMKKNKIYKKIFHLVFLFFISSTLVSFFNEKEEEPKNTKTVVNIDFKSKIDNYVYEQALYKEDLERFKKYDEKIVSDYHLFLKENSLIDDRSERELLSLLSSSRVVFEYKLDRFEKEIILGEDFKVNFININNGVLLRPDGLNDNAIFKYLFFSKNENLEPNSFYVKKKTTLGDIYIPDMETYIEGDFYKNDEYLDLNKNLKIEKINRFILKSKLSDFIESKNIVRLHYKEPSYQNIKMQERKVFSYLPQEVILNAENKKYKEIDLKYKWLEKEERLNSYFEYVNHYNYISINTLKEIRLNKLVFDELQKSYMKKFQK